MQYVLTCVKEPDYRLLPHYLAPLSADHLEPAFLDALSRIILTNLASPERHLAALGLHVMLELATLATRPPIQLLVLRLLRAPSSRMEPSNISAVLQALLRADPLVGTKSCCGVLLIVDR